MWEGLLPRRGGLTFLAVDGRRKQVTLNLLVLFKGTLDLCPCHELVDLSGDLPKFLKGQRTNLSPEARNLGRGRTEILGSVCCSLPWSQRGETVALCS